MMYSSNDMEMRAALSAAESVCAAARTAPKACGIDHLVTLSEQSGMGFLMRDAGNVRAAQVLVLFGVKEEVRGLGEICGYCHYKNCAECKKADGVCVYDPMDLGIALGSAAAVAADCRVDNRILFSAGRAAMEMGIMGEGVSMACGLPLAISGKSPFFDRKPKK